MRKHGLNIGWMALCILASCQGALEPEQTKADDCQVVISIGIASIDTESPTKSEESLRPSIENTISNIWILQYSREGFLQKTIYQEIETPVQYMPSLNVPLVRLPDSRIVIVANMGKAPGRGDDPEWPYDGSFNRWPGSYYQLRNKLFRSNLSDLESEESRDNVEHLFLFGETEMDVEEGSAVNVMLSRCTSKIRVAIYQDGTEFYDVKLQIVNAPSMFEFFPAENALWDESHFLDYEEESICSGTLPKERQYRYYYIEENLSSSPDFQTKLKITARSSVDGQFRTRLVPLSLTGMTYRNVFYNVDIRLSSARSTNP